MKLSTAIILSVILHLGLVALLALNFQFSKVEIKQSSAGQPKINARAIDSKRVEQLVKNLKQQTADKKRQEQQRLDNIKKAEEASKRKRKEAEQKAADAIKKSKAAEAKRKSEEKKAADLKKKRIKDEQQRKQKADSEKKQREEAERKKKADAEQKRKAKEEAESKRKAAEEKARKEAMEREMNAQMEAQAAELAAAHQQQVLSEVDKFNSLIEGKIRRNWFKPEKQGSCTFRISISPGGLVFNIQVLEGDTAYCDSGRRAIRRAEPLPMSKDPDVFEVLKLRTFKLDSESNE